MKFKDRRENWCALTLVVAFFLPWVSVFIVSVNGLDLATGGGSLADLGRQASSKHGQDWYWYLLFLVPLLAALHLVLALRFDRYHKALAVATGAVPVALFAYALARSGGKLFNFLGIGAWLTVIAGIVMFLLALGVIKRKQA